MNNDDSNQHLEGRISRVEGEIAQIVASVKDLTKSVTSLHGDIAELSNRLSDKTAPNFSLLASWSGILLTIIGMVAAPVGYFVIREIERQSQVSVQLDTKLQKESSLVSDKMLAEFNAIHRELDDVKNLGSPVTRERLAKNESDALWMRRELDVIRDAGSPIMRERMARIESRLDEKK